MEGQDGTFLKQINIFKKKDNEMKPMKNRMRKEKNNKERAILKQRLKQVDGYINNQLEKKQTVKINKIVEEIKNGGGVDSEIFWTVRNKIIGMKREGKYAVEDKNGILKKTHEEKKSTKNTLNNC